MPSSQTNYKNLLPSPPSLILLLLQLAACITFIAVRMKVNKGSTFIGPILHPRRERLTHDLTVAHIRKIRYGLYVSFYYNEHYLQMDMHACMKLIYEDLGLFSDLNLRYSRAVR